VLAHVDLKLTKTEYSVYHAERTVYPVKQMDRIQDSRYVLNVPLTLKDYCQMLRIVQHQVVHQPNLLLNSNQPLVQIVVQIVKLVMDLTTTILLCNSGFVDS